MKSLSVATFFASLALTLASCSQSDSQKLAHDAKMTGEAVKQTASDALDATQKASDKLSVDTQNAVNSPTAKDIEAKTKRGAQRVVAKTKELARQVQDDS